MNLTWFRTMQSFCLAMTSALLFCTTTLPCCCMAWMSSPLPSSGTISYPKSTTTLFYQRDSHGAATKFAQELPLTAHDMALLQDVRSRHLTLPILVLESSILPGQRIEFASSDPKFKTMIHHVLEQGDEEEGGAVGLVGISPHSSRPLNLGVTFRLKKHQVYTNDKGELVISIQGDRRFEILGDVWEDETGSFNLAGVDLTERDANALNEEQFHKANWLNTEMPDVVDAWIAWVLSKGYADSKQIKTVLQDLGPMPDEWGNRAIWVAALLNPTILPDEQNKLRVSTDIRPSMLLCRNDYDRLALAYAAMTTSIDYMSGKEKLMF